VLKAEGQMSKKSFLSPGAQMILVMTTCYKINKTRGEKRCCYINTAQTCSAGAKDSGFFLG